MSNTEITLQKPVLAVIENVGAEITSPAEMETQVANLSLLNKELKRITEHKETKTKPLNAALKAIRADYKPFEDQLEKAITVTRKAISKYQTEEKKRADEEKAKIDARVKPGKGNLSFETAVERAKEVDTPAEVVATEVGKVSFRTTRKFELEDITKVPHEYLVLNETAVRSALKEGVEVPGIRYWNEETPINSRL